MHFERLGGAPNLPTEFHQVILTLPGGRSLDQNRNEESKGGKFPDFACFNELVLIEMKHLESDQSERLNGVFEQLVDDKEKPLFFGSREAGPMIESMSNGNEIGLAIARKLGSSVEGILKTANSQFKNYRDRHLRKNSINLCVILNSKIMEFTPDVMGYALQKKIKSGSGDLTRFPFIDAIIYISEKHYQLLPDGRIAFSLLVFQNIGSLRAPWKLQFINRLVEAWSQRRTGGRSSGEADIKAFKTVFDVPKRMKRSELWNLEYLRNPYLSNLPLGRLRVLFNRAIGNQSRSFIKGDWPKPSREEMMEWMRRFQHHNAEINRRNIDVRDMHLSLLTESERIEAFGGLPEELVKILTRSISKD